ncbi:MAG TPA: universal stress protein [candidate division Zixibacteria bacterium]|nr:universal stress protein [candidate division Zixibacteria bacterium]
MSFKRILVPLDGSKLAERALVPALALAGAMSAKLFFIRVVIPLSLNLDPKFYQHIIEVRQDGAKRYLRSIQPRFSSTLVDIETQVVVGRAARSIINFAQEKEIDLIVMSSHGRSGVNRWIYGGVADKVLHNAPCAKVIIHPQVIVENYSIKRIFVPLDGSSIAEQALEPALALAEAVSAELILHQVTTAPQIYVKTLPGWPGFDVVQDAAEQEASSYLQCVQSAMADSPVPSAFRVTTGPAAEGIIDIADRQKVDLIVMCSLGCSGIERWVFGSVAEKVLRGANCVTLVIQGQEDSK